MTIPMASRSMTAKLTWSTKDTPEGRATHAGAPDSGQGLERLSVAQIDDVLSRLSGYSAGLAASLIALRRSFIKRNKCKSSVGDHSNPMPSPR